MSPLDLEKQEHLGDTALVFTTAILPEGWKVSGMVPPAGVGEEGDLARKAIALAQVEDDHPLPVPGVPGIGCAVLDTHSVVAVSSQGAAQLYAEQSALPGKEVTNSTSSFFTVE